MRVSKVSVDVPKEGKKMVLMSRDQKQGKLVIDKQIDEDKTSVILPDLKTDSFNLSVENKTMVRRDSIINKNKDIQYEERRKYDILKKILKNEELPKEILKQNIVRFLGHKFEKEISYYPTKEATTPLHFNLTDLILDAVKYKSFDKLQPYYDWKDWYIKSKSDYLKTSIKNNIIYPDGELNKRQEALNFWESKYVSKGDIDLCSVESAFKIHDLAVSLNQTYQTKLNDAKTINKTIFQIKNEFHRALKSALQTHQKNIFGTKDAPNIGNRNDAELHTYQMEVVKYMERYFPVKASKRTKTEDDISYYLNENTIKTIVKKQILNSVRARMLQQGKAQQHDYAGKGIDSARLSDIKRNEAFVLNLIDACAFAANNIRNMVDIEQTNDIIDKGYFKDSLTKNKINSRLFKLFYNQPLSDNADNKTLWAMRGSVQQIRNEIVHYKQDAYKRIFNVQQFEFEGYPDTDYTQSIFKTCLENELASLPQMFAEQLKTGGTLAYYQLSDIEQLMANSHFTLYRSVIPFTPGFKKVYKHGQNFQNAEKNADFYDLKISAFPEIDFTKVSQEYQAYYFTLKLIYNHWFLPEFSSDKAQFETATKEVLKINKANAAGKKNRNAYAFQAVRSMEPRESIKDYMAYIQSQWMYEANKKEDIKPGDKNLNFEKFMLQVFIKGFDMFMAKNKQTLSFISNPVSQLLGEITNQQKADKLNHLEKQLTASCKHIKPLHIDTAKSEHIAFFCFAKLLDATHLSTLRNELIKYGASIHQQNAFDYVSEIIELCLYSCDRIPAGYADLYADKKSALQRIEPFLDEHMDIKSCADLFVQSDHETPVVHSNIELAVKYGTASLLQKLAEKEPKIKLTESNFNDWNKHGKLMEKLIKKRQELHEQWEAAQKTDDTEKTNKEKERTNAVGSFLKKNADDYYELCEFIDDYNWLDNKLHFVHLNRIHLLTIDILGRLAGFVAIYDRDFQMVDYQNTSDIFQLKAFVSLRDIEKDLKSETISKIVDKHYIVKRDNTVITESDRQALVTSIMKKREHYKRVFFCGYNPFEIRPYVAHFNYLSKTASKSLLDLINEIRNLLSYDRKLKNAVTQSIIKIFDKHGMLLQFEFEKDAAGKHRLKNEVKVEPKKLNHLGTKGTQTITSNQVHPVYAAMCKSLLEMKN